MDIAESSAFPVSVDAFDVDPKPFPPRAWRPCNLRLCVQDVFAPFPEEMRGAFHVVHLRWWLTLSAAQVKDLVETVRWLLSKFAHRIPRGDRSSRID